MFRMFKGAAAFNGDLSSWDVSKVGGMAGMFMDAAAFNGDLSSWNVSKVGNMGNMFDGTNGGNYDTKTKAPWYKQ